MDSRPCIPGSDHLRTTAFNAAILSLGLSTASLAGEVSGTVYDQRGVPAAGVVLVLGAQDAVTSDDGSYRFADVAEGEHLIATYGQRVSVQVGDDAATKRNIFLMSRHARAEVTGTTLDADAAEAAFAEAMQLADQMVSEGEAQGEVAWRWNDLEG